MLMLGSPLRRLLKASNALLWVSQMLSTSASSLAKAGGIAVWYVVLGGASAIRVHKK
jgi:hypothetical protein